MIKFAFVLTDLSGGGAEKAILNIASHLVSCGHNVDIILLRNIIKYPLHHSLNLTTLADNPSFGWFGKRLLVYKLSKLIEKKSEKQAFDVIVSTLPLADEIALMAKLPNHWCRIANTLSIEVSKLALSNVVKSIRRYKRYQQRYNAKQLITVSEGVKQDLQENFHLKDTDIRVIYNPFDPLYIQQRAQEPFDIPQQPYVIHVGRFSVQKRHDVLLEAYAKIHNSHLLVLLTNENEALRQLIAKNDLSERIIVTGFQVNPYSWMANAALLILSSDHEGMPNVIIESLMVETPVVSTDCPSGPREILGELHEQCLVPVGNVKQLAKTIDWALDNACDMSDIDLTIYQAANSIEAYEALARREE